MKRSILLALHGSESESAAQELAVHWARRADAEVTGLSIVDETVAKPESAPIGGGAFQKRKEADLLSEHQQLAETAAEIFSKRAQAAQIEFTIEREAGVPHDIVSSQAQQHDLVVVDSQSSRSYGAGESPLEVLEHLIRTSPRPVVSCAREYRPGERILVAYDGSRLASKALFGLVGSGFSTLSPIRLLTVDRDSNESAERRAANGLKYLERLGVECDFASVVSDRPVSEILCEEASRLRSELVVLGPHGRGAVAEFFLGSVTKEVVANSETPVFLYH